MFVLAFENSRETLVVNPFVYFDVQIRSNCIFSSRYSPFVGFFLTSRLLLSYLLLLISGYFFNFFFS